MFQLGRNCLSVSHDFGFGKPGHGGPVVSGNNEFVLLSDGKSERNGGGINAWLGLEHDKMKEFMHAPYF